MKFNMNIKFIKFALASTAVALSLSMQGISASAEDFTLIYDDEISQILTAVEEYNNGMSDPVVYAVPPEYENSEAVAINMSIYGYNIENAYKINFLDLSITEYQNSHDFKSLIKEDDVRIILPADGKVVTFHKEDSGYKWCGATFTDEWQDFNSIIKELTNSIDEEIINVVHGYSYYYYMDVIYIETTENEYAVPYFVDYYGEMGDKLISGTMYTVPDFMNRMDEVYDEGFTDEELANYDPAEGGIAGGVGLKSPESKESNAAPLNNNLAAQNSKISLSNDESHNYFAIVSAAIAAVATISTLAAFIILNKKKSNK